MLFGAAVNVDSGLEIRSNWVYLFRYFTGSWPSGTGWIRAAYRAPASSGARSASGSGSPVSSARRATAPRCTACRRSRADRSAPRTVRRWTGTAAPSPVRPWTARPCIAAPASSTA